MRARLRLLPVATLLVLAVAASATASCAQGGDGGSAPTPPGGEGDPGAPAPPGSRGTEGADEPGSKVVFLNYPAKNSDSDARWGAAATDVRNHISESMVATYWDDSDFETAAHETTHGINSEVRNNETHGKKANGFYVMKNRAAIIVEPNIRKSAMVPYVPASLHGDRYDLYVVGQTEWDDTPTYIFDEWIAYTNGAEACVDLESHGNWKTGWTDCVMGPLEFVVYSVAIAEAVSKGDSTYWASADGAQFKEFVAFSIKRAMDLYRQGSVMTDFKWDKMDAYYKSMAEGADAAEWRAFAKSTWGADWIDQVVFGKSGPIVVPDAGPPPVVDSGPPPVVDSGPPPVVDSGPGPIVDSGPVPTPGDEDGDGIGDAVDLCSRTPHGAPVWTFGDWIGCTTGQHRDGGGGADSDRDGIPDNKDQCKDTPVGAPVWKYGVWIGCAEGQRRG